MERPVSPMMEASPGTPLVHGELFARAIEACLDTAQACMACADACLTEEDPRPLVACIRLNLDCAEVCQTTASMLSRQLDPPLELLAAQLQVCALACRLCALECDQHAEHHEHCRVCAEVCGVTERACGELVSELTAGQGGG